MRIQRVYVSIKYRKEIYILSNFCPPWISEIVYMSPGRIYILLLIFSIFFAWTLVSSLLCHLPISSNTQSHPYFFELGILQKHEKATRSGRILNVFEDFRGTKYGAIRYQRGQKTFCPQHHELLLINCS